jgi:hypothetical protein
MFDRPWEQAKYIVERKSYVKMAAVSLTIMKRTHLPSMEKKKSDLHIYMSNIHITPEPDKQNERFI